MVTGHNPVDWVTRGVYPSCSCGFAPKDNRALNEHWASFGFVWVDNHGTLIQREIVQILDTREGTMTYAEIKQALADYDEAKRLYEQDMEESPGMGASFEIEEAAADAVKRFAEAAAEYLHSPGSTPVPFIEKNPKGLYLRTVWADGTTASGREFEVAQSGVTLIFTLGTFSDDAPRTVDELRLEDLVKAWLAMRGES